LRVWFVQHYYLAPCTHLFAELLFLLFLFLFVYIGLYLCCECVSLFGCGFGMFVCFRVFDVLVFGSGVGAVIVLCYVMF